MTNPDDETEQTTPTGAFSTAARHAQHAMDSAKGIVAGADLDQLRTKAADAASAIYREGRELLASEEVAKAKDQLSELIRKQSARRCRDRVHRRRSHCAADPRIEPMIHELVALAETQAKTAVRRVAISTAFALVAGLFVLFAVAGLFAALFFWFEPEDGPIAAALICTGVAIILALLALLPLAFKRRPARGRSRKARCRSSCR